MNILYIICLIIFTIFYIFYILNKYILDKSYELFNTTSSGLLCGTDNNVCRINQYAISSCCDGYTCMRKEGNFQFKVCIDNSKLSGSSSEINLNKLRDKLSIANIDGKYGKYNKHNIPKSPTSPDLDEYLYIFDDEIINNIIDYLNKLNMKDNLLIFNLREYLYGLLLTSEEHNYDFNDLYLYISNLELNDIDTNILINIKNYLNGLNMPSNSILIELKNYLNGLNLPDNSDLKYQLSDYVLLNYYVINNILNYLNTVNLTNDSNYIMIKNDLEDLKKLIELNFKNNIEISKLTDYLNLINYFKLKDNMTIGELINFFNSINMKENDDIINFKNYINNLDLPNNITISQLKINFNNYLNTINTLNLPSNINIGELKDYLTSLNIQDKNNQNLFDFKNFINTSKLSDNIQISQLKIDLNSYLNTIKNLNLINDMSLGDLRIYLNTTNINTSNINTSNINTLNTNIVDFKNYISNLNISYNLTIGDLKININDKIKKYINEYISSFQNNISLMQNLNITELSNIGYIINIKNYLNALKISNDIVLSKLSIKLNNINLSNIGKNIGIPKLDFIEDKMDKLDNYLKNLSVCNK